MGAVCACDVPVEQDGAPRNHEPFAGKEYAKDVAEVRLELVDMQYPVDVLYEYIYIYIYI